MSVVWTILACMATGTLATVIVSALAAGAREDAIRETRASGEAALLDAIRAREQTSEMLGRAQSDAARWRDRALLCEEHGPTVGEVDEVYRENARLKAELAILRGPKA